jgi:hypothetical protein
VAGRGAPYFLREREDAFHVFLYAPRAEKVRRSIADGGTLKDAEELVETGGSGAHNLHQALFQCRLAYPRALPHDDQHLDR